MSICAEPGAVTPQNMSIYMAARLKAGIRNRDDAAEKFFVSESTMERIESKQRKLKPQEVIDMADKYGQPQLPILHCQHECPIGRRYMTRAEPKDLRASALGIASLLREAYEARDRLIEIAVDGIVSEAERPCMEKILALLRDMKAEIKSLEMWLMQEGLDFGQKEKSLCAATK